MTAAVTGANQSTLRSAGIEYEVVRVHAGHHAGYFPGAEQLHLVASFAPDGRLLGAQGVGRDGVDKRIDVLATALRAEMTADDLAELELAYAPPYGSAKDAVNMLGFVAQNALDGTMPQWHPRSLSKSAHTPSCWMSAQPRSTPPATSTARCTCHTPNCVTASTRCVPRPGDVRWPCSARAACAPTSPCASCAERASMPAASPAAGTPCAPSRPPLHRHSRPEWFNDHVALRNCQT